MWAPSIVEKGGKYYLFCAANDIQNDQQLGGIGVTIGSEITRRRLRAARPDILVREGTLREGNVRAGTVRASIVLDVSL